MSFRYESKDRNGQKNTELIEIQDQTLFDKNRLDFLRGKDPVSRLERENKTARNSRWEIGVDITQSDKRLRDSGWEIGIAIKQEIRVSTKQETRVITRWETKVDIRGETRIEGLR